MRTPGQHVAFDSEVTKLRALGLGSDISNTIQSHSAKLEQQHGALKKLVNEGERNIERYRPIMETRISPFKTLKKFIKCGSALVSQMEWPRKAKKSKKSETK